MVCNIEVKDGISTADHHESVNLASVTSCSEFIKVSDTYCVLWLLFLNH